MILQEALDRLPKVELHCHIEGTMRPQTFVDLARKSGRELKVEDPSELYRYTSLDSFLEVFWFVQACLGDRDDWARLARESVVDGAAHGLIYRESFFTPARHMEMGQRLEDIVAGLEEGLAAGEQETGVPVMLVADIDKAYGGAAGLELVEEIVALKRAGKAERIIGIGMDSTESGTDPRHFLDAYRTAAGAGLRRTGHQGETTDAGLIAVVVDELGAERIDHGISIVQDPELMKRFAGERIPFNVCPVSNVKIANAVGRLEDHPWPVMREAGLLMSLNTDDPAMIDSDLGKEYAAVAEAFGYSFDDMVEISLDGVESTWLGADDKAELRSRMREEATRLSEAMA